jgi:hypothetical protein
MLRKKLVALVAAALMTLTASSAFAAFADSHLIRVYYDRAGAEYATDLGLISSVLTSATAPAGVTFGGALGTATHAVYFAYDRATAVNDLYVSGVNKDSATFTGAPQVIGVLTGMNNGTTPMYAQFNTMGGTNYTGLASAASSYKNKLSSVQGYFGNTLTATNSARTYAELPLATLVANNTQSLWFFDTPTATTVAGKTGVAVAQIITNADGSTTITAVATPIPAAIYLMGSGLLGLVGLRRRNRA